MKQHTMKQVTALVWFLFIGLLPRTLLADAPIQNTDPQKQGSNDPSWPMAKLLDPSFKWEKSTGTFHEGLVVCPLDPQHPTIMNYSGFYAVDAAGEWFTTVISTGNTSKGVAANYDSILKEAGYGENIPLPDKHILIGCQTTPLEQTVSSYPPGYSVEGYIKRSGLNIRAILISRSPEYDKPLGNETGKEDVGVFVSKITSLKDILKK